MDAHLLLDLIHEWLPRLEAIGGKEADIVVGSAWTRKEVLGHLIDSALNNHQRFIRLQAGDLEGFPGYDQDMWVAANRYRNGEWNHLVQLWLGLNRHLGVVIEGIPEGAGGHVWRTKGVDLDFLVTDYSRHLLHHLERMRV